MLIMRFEGLLKQYHCEVQAQVTGVLVVYVLGVKICGLASLRIYMLFTGREVRIEKNCARGLE